MLDAPSSYSPPMKLRFLGANRQVTGSCYLLEAAGLRILIDCGLFQERPFLTRNWDPFPEPVSSINYLLLTHAHLDHCGRIPKLYNDGFRAPIYTTAASRELSRLVLLDAAGIQEEDATFKRKRHEREGRPGARDIMPLYTVADAEESLRLFQSVNYHDPIKLNEHVTAIYRDAGHVLGSAFLEINVTEDGRSRRLIFSGDLGQDNKPIIRDPEKATQADVVVMESTYGDRDHNRSTVLEDALADEINAGLQAGGNILIPTFAIERAQELIFYFMLLHQGRRIGQFPVYLDSPMAVDATALFGRHQNIMDDQARMLFKTSGLRFPGLRLSKTREESKAINDVQGGAVIMAGSGMCTGGRIKHHLARNISNPAATVLFVGFQSPGTLGREILDGRAQVRIHGQLHPVRARIRQVSGMSAHADRTALIKWISSFSTPPARVFLTHGEEAVSLRLNETLRPMRNWEVRVPSYGDVVEL